jgi:hypothetical protein
MAGPSARLGGVVPRRIAVVGAAALPFLLLFAGEAGAFAITGTVWNIPNDGGLITYDPSIGRVGNTGNDGLLFSIGDVPAAAQGGAAAAVAGAFGMWSALGASGARIKLTAKGNQLTQVEVKWSNTTAEPGVALTRNVPAIPNPIPLSSIFLNGTRTLRTDGWNIDLAGNRPAVINEYDIATVTVHEVGHALGLAHPGNATAVMTSQDVARGDGGSWRAIEQTAPFANQPTTLAGAALPKGALAYLNPRAALSADDILGAVTLYTGPSAHVPGGAEALGGGQFRYSYTPKNTANALSDYRVRLVEIPVPKEVKVTNIVAPDGWTGERTETAVRFTFNGAGGLKPGESVPLKFDADAPPKDGRFTVRWSTPDIENGGRGRGGDLIDDEDSPPVLDFNPQDFAVLDGDFNFELDSIGAWDLVRFDDIPEPGFLAEPGTLALLAAGTAFLALRRRPAMPG